SLRDGGVKGRYPPPPLTLSLDRLALDGLRPDGLEPDQFEPVDRLTLAGPSDRVLPLLVLPLGGVNGRKPPWFPFPADGPMLRWVWPLPGAEVRGFPSFG